ncbi:hypothetical protein D3C81_2034680 [compost metagenome]
MGEHPGDPCRGLGDRFERQARQHFGDLMGVQGKALVADAEHQVQGAVGGRILIAARLKVVHRQVRL